MKLFLLLAAVVSATNALTNLNINKITVQVGPDGTDDNVRIKICDKSKCCHTNKLSHTFSSEWVDNQLEIWDGRKLGNCSSILFDTEEAGLDVVILKENKKQDTLQVATIILEGAPLKSKGDKIRFTCGSYSFGVRDTEKSRYCLSSKGPGGVTGRPVSAINLNINKIAVQVGPDGTKDDVFMQICDGSRCCHTKELSHFLSSEWVANKLETWDGGKLGNCSNILLDSGAPGLDVSVIKTIKKQDTLVITSILLEGAPTTDKRNIIRFSCGSFQFGKKDVKKSQYCSSNSAPTTKRPTITKRPTATTRRPTATTRRPTATTRRPTATTKRPSIGSNENLKLSNIIVQMGKDGTNDDVSMKICHAEDNKCCETGNLDGGILSDDWSRNDKETWGNKNLGVCKNLHWDGCKGLEITLKKKPSKDTLKVSNITIELTDKINPKKTERFLCPSYDFLPTDKEKKNTCILERSSSLSCRTTTRRPGALTTRRTTTRRPRPGSVTIKPLFPKGSVTTRRPGAITTRRPGSVTIKPLFPNNENIVINRFEVEIGKDGTKDPVTVKVCAGRSCCTTPQLSKLPLNNSWKRNTNETWLSSDLGDCRGKSLPTSIRKTISNLQETQLTLTIQRKGRDGLKLNNLFIIAETASGDVRRFKCGKIVVTDQSESKDCFWQGIASVSQITTQRAGPCLRSGRNCATTKTTRPPFRSGK